MVSGPGDEEQKAPTNISEPGSRISNGDDCNPEQLSVDIQRESHKKATPRLLILRKGRSYCFKLLGFA